MTDLIKGFYRRLDLRKAHRIARAQLSARMEKCPSIRFEWVEHGLCAFDVIIRRDGAGYIVQTHGHWLGHMQSRTATWIYWLSKAPPEVREIMCDTGDGDAPSTATFCFSDHDPRRVLMPDAFFFREFGYRATRAHVDANPIRWADRSDDLVWRGAPNGLGRFTTDPALQTHAGVNQRLRMAIKCQSLDVDFLFLSNGGAPGTFVEHHGLSGARIPEFSWGGRKFAIDIDGHSNAWDNLMNRLHLGCCVLKVGSRIGYRQWYYDRMEPYRHYVPVKADLSDLEQQIDWMKSHDTEAQEIAAEGQALARSLTWESETAFAAGQIAKHATRT